MPRTGELELAEMSEEPKAPNLTLRRIREQELHMTRVEFAEALGLKSYEIGDSLEPSERYIARLELGEIRWQQSPYRRALEALCGRPMADLGFGASRRPTGVALVVPIDHSAGADPLQDSAWPTWFGIRLAHLVALTQSWRFQNRQVNALQGIPRRPWQPTSR